MVKQKNILLYYPTINKCDITYSQIYLVVITDLTFNNYSKK